MEYEGRENLLIETSINPTKSVRALADEHPRKAFLVCKGIVHLVSQQHIPYQKNIPFTPTSRPSLAAYTPLKLFPPASLLLIRHRHHLRPFSSTPKTTMTTDDDIPRILTFWFGAPEAPHSFDRWFSPDPTLDDQIRSEFGSLVLEARKASSPLGRNSKGGPRTPHPPRTIPAQHLPRLGGCVCVGSEGAGCQREGY